MNKRYEFDRILLLALLMGFIFCMYGIHWGWVESWNVDQMAFRDLFRKGKLPFNPGWFGKPPFHTYFVFFLSVLPFEILGKALDLPPEVLYTPKLVWTRMLTVFLFLGAIALSYRITKRFFGVFAARMVAVLFATSAGFIGFSHFLTADIPVMFWMLLALYFAQNILLNGRLSNYVLSGFFTGIAAATKYNGLGTAIAIIAAHVLSLGAISRTQWKTLFFDKKLLTGLFIILIGFLVGNPFALLDHATFISNFLFNYHVTPVYDGSVGGHGYWKFFQAMASIIGFPSFLACSCAFLYSLFMLTAKKGNLIENKGIVLLLSVFLLYYWKIGSFPRLPARFVLPIVPFWIMLSGPFWNKIKGHKSLITGLLVMLLGYNLLCGFCVGKRFLQDPRMLAQDWVQAHIPSGSRLERSFHSPRFAMMPGVYLRELWMPFISGRTKQFERQFKDLDYMRKRLRHERKREAILIHYYTKEHLLKRNSSYIAVNSLYYDRFFKNRGKDYPSMQRFFSELLNGCYPYRIVFDKQTPKISRWIYPQEIDFLDNRMVILAREDISRPEP